MDADAIERETVVALPDTPRVQALRTRVRRAMAVPPLTWECPPRIDDVYLSEPIPVRKARAIALKRGGYEARPWGASKLAPEALQTIADRSIALLEDLYE